MKDTLDMSSNNVVGLNNLYRDSNNLQPITIGSNGAPAVGNTILKSIQFTEPIRLINNYNIMDPNSLRPSDTIQNDEFCIVNEDQAFIYVPQGCCGRLTLDNIKVKVAGLTTTGISTCLGIVIRSNVTKRCSLIHF